MKRNVSGGGRWDLGARWPWAGSSPLGSPAQPVRAVPGLCTSGSNCLQLLGRAQAAVRAGCPSFGDLPGALRHPLRAGKKGPGERKEQDTGQGVRGEDCLFVLKKLLAFPKKSENPAGETIFPLGTPTSKSSKPEAHICFCF